MSDRRLSIFNRYAAPIVVPGLILMTWQLSVDFGLIPSTIFASPTSVIHSFFALSQSGELLSHSVVSLNRLFVGFLIGALLGFCTGILIGTYKELERYFSPTLSLLSPIPPVAWIPLLIIFFGIGEGSKIALIAIGAFFTVLPNVINGIRDTDVKYVELSRCFEKSRAEMIWEIFIPSAFSQLMISARVALGLCWILLIAAEVIASSSGLGWLIWDSRNFSRPDEMLVGMVTVGILGKGTDVLLKILQDRFLVWKKAYAGEI